MKKKIIIISVIAFALIIVFPLLIHMMYKIQAPHPFFEAVWTAGDTLSYYGILIGAIATVLGVFYSIQYAQSNYREDVRNRSLPFMDIAGMQVKTNSMFCLEPEDNTATIPLSPSSDAGEEYRLHKLYYVITNGKVTIKKDLLESQKRLIRNNGFREQQAGNGVSFSSVEHIVYLPLEIENVGVGAAVTFSVGLYRPGTGEKEQVFSLPTSLKVGDVFHISIYCENRTDLNLGDYTLCISYYDILGNRYEQKCIFTVFKNSSGNVGCSLKLDGTQRRL